MEWSKQQDDALRSAAAWYKSTDSEPFTLQGWAGSGKTTLAIEIASRIGGRVLFAAPTGKAASVMGEKGCGDPTTVHRLIYLPKSKSRLRLLEMEAQLQRLKDQQGPDLENQSQINALEWKIRDETKNVKRPMFTLNLDSDLKNADLLILDESSMVNEQMGQDLMSFGTKVLALGDPAQLPPVRGPGFFDTKRPSFMLTEIHRQAKDNPIIHLATMIRNHEELEYGDYGTSRVMDWADVEPDVVTSHDQLIVYANKTRKGANRRIREFKGLGDGKPGTPIVGDKLVCLRNNYELGLLNGVQWDVTRCEDVDDHSIMLSVQNGSERVDCVAHKAPFMDREIPHYDHSAGVNEFDYAYAMTCHKAQGSEWDNVLILDESRMAKQNKHRWLYTAITRASRKVTIAR